ncbi:hypothetical protein ACJJIG_02560 [Microbulbifer sp. SSSA007]|uniref:hypothetical protein n=1 Tax=Microbulbifer sp. SSSA007 TaxID=3243379 RepID=UPI004039C3C6
MLTSAGNRLPKRSLVLQKAAKQAPILSASTAGVTRQGELVLNRKLVVVFFVLIPCLVLVFLPIYSVVSGYLNPSLEHLERARNYLPNSKLLQIGFGSGSYSCINGECDYSNTYDQKQFISVSSASKIVTIRRSYEGEWTESVEETNLKLGLSLLAIYTLAIFGLGFSLRELRRV